METPRAERGEVDEEAQAEEGSKDKGSTPIRIVRYESIQLAKMLQLL